MRLGLRGLLLAAAMAGAAAAATAQTTGPRIVASFPAGAFLENLLVRPGGVVLYTHYFAREIGRVRDGVGDGQPIRTAFHPVSLAPGQGGVWVAGHGVSFLEGARIAGSNLVQFIGDDGVAGRSILLPGAVFLNGMVAQGEHILLIADSVLGRIWRVDLRDGSAGDFLETPDMSGTPDRPGVPGVNGLKLVQGALLFSNSARPGLYRVALAGDGSATGPVVRVLDLPSIDDFVATADGGFIIATHGRDVIRVGPDGRRVTLLDQDVEGNTAVALVPRTDGRNDLYVTATGGLLERKGQPANLVVIAID